MLLTTTVSLALFPALVLGDNWHRDYVDHGFVQAPYEAIEEIRERVDYAKERVHDKVLGCQPSSTVVYGTTLVHQTVTSPPPYATPTAYPNAKIVGVSTVDRWGTLLTWEQHGTTTLPVPCHTAAGHHHGHREWVEWSVVSKRLPDGDITIRNPFAPTSTLAYHSTPTPTYHSSRDCSGRPSGVPVVERPGVPVVERPHVPIFETPGVPVENPSVVTVTRVVDRYPTATVTVHDPAKPCITTVTTIVNPIHTPSVNQPHYPPVPQCIESHTVEGWKYRALQDNYSDIYVNYPFESKLTITGVYVPTNKFQVRIDGKDHGWTSEPRGGQASACCDMDSGEKCISGGASWGQWTLSPGPHKVVVTSSGPSRGYILYKISACK